MTDTTDRFDLINVIADAALKLLTDMGCKTDKMSVFMDIDNVDQVCPLRLVEFAACALGDTPEDRRDFNHDVIGIWNHFNRQTKQLENCFLPRFAL